MRNSIVLSSVILIYAVSCWSQAYYEASGQTVAFTLTVGAKAGPSAIKRGPAVGSGQRRGFSVVTSRGCIVVTLPGMHRGSADIALYDIRGRQVYRQRKDGPSLRLDTQQFAPGMYTVLIRFDGQMYSHRIVAYGRGE